MAKPIGSRPNQLPSNDQLGRFAFLDELPPDVLAELQALAWHFTAGVQVDSGPTLAGSNAVANQAYVQQVMNGAVGIQLSNGAQVVASAETLATRTLILTGNVSTSAQLSLSIPGQWFVINRCTGGSVTLVGIGSNAVSLNAGESTSIFADSTGVSALSPSLGSFLTNGQGRLINIQRFLNAGTFKYTKSPGTRMVLVFGAGAGAASAGLPECAPGYVAVAQSGSPGARAFAIYTDGFDGTIITVGAAGASIAANDDGQTGLDGGTSSFGTLLTIPGGKGGMFATTDSANGVTAYLGAAAKAPSGSGIVTANYGKLSPAAFVNAAGMFGGIERLGEGLEASMNGLGGVGQVSSSGNAASSTPTNAGFDGGFLIYELT